MPRAATAWFSQVIASLTSDQALFFKHITAYTTSLEGRMGSSGHHFASSSASLNPGTGSLKRGARKRHKQAPRSNNPVIDLWQQQDRDLEYGDEDGGPDSFADLEGFLVVD